MEKRRKQKITSVCSDGACVASRWHQGLAVAGWRLARLVEQRRAGVGLQRLTRRWILRELLGAIIVFGEGDSVADAGVQPLVGCQRRCVSRPVLSFEAGAPRTVLPAPAAVVVITFSIICSGNLTRPIEWRVNRAAEVRLRVSIARLRRVPWEGTNVVPSRVGERRQPRELSPRRSKIRKVKGVSSVDVYQRSHKPWIKKIMLAHFRGPDQQLLVYCNLTFNIVKPGGPPDWSSLGHVTRLTPATRRTTHPAHYKQNINFCIRAVYTFFKNTINLLLICRMLFLFPPKGAQIAYCVRPVELSVGSLIPLLTGESFFTKRKVSIYLSIYLDR